MGNVVSSLDGVGLRLLGLLIVGGADVDVELSELGPAETVVRNHASDGALDEELGFARAHFLGGFHLLPSDVSGVAGVNFLGFLVAGEAHLLGIDDHDVIARVGMRSKDGLMLPTKEAGSFHRNLAENLIGSVDDIPFALYFGGFG